VPKFCVGTAGGALYAVLTRLQRAVYATAPLGRRFQEYRALRKEPKRKPASGFVDGDLIQSILEMPDHDVERVVEAFNQGLPTPAEAASSSVRTSAAKAVTAAELVALVEELSRLV